MISVIILTRNRLEHLKRLFTALDAQTFRDFEIIVVDTGSRDGTLEWLSSHSTRQLTIVDFSPETGGFAEARNKGIQQARGDSIAFIDDDCEPPSDWLDTINKHMDSCDAVGGTTIPPASLKIPRWWSSELNWLVGLTPDIPDIETRGAVYPQAANLALSHETARREAFQELGAVFGAKAHAPSVYAAGREDAELWWRLRIKGYRTRFLTEIAVIHHIPASRFRLPYLVQRAFRDGYVLYMRQRQDGYLSLATYQMFDIFSRIARRYASRRRFIPAIVHETMWSVRQFGFICSFAGLKKDYAAIAENLLGGFIQYGAAITKSIARNVFVSGFRFTRPRKKIGINPADSILLICSGFVGDFIIIQPAIRELGKRFPASRLVLLCNENGYDLYKNRRDLLPIDELVALPSTSGRQKKIIHTLLGKERFTAGIIFYYHNASCAPLFLHHSAPPLVSFSSDVGFSKQTWYNALDSSLTKDFTQNEILNHMKFVSFLTGSNAGIEPEQYRYDVDETVQQKFLPLLQNEHDSLVIGINTGTALPEKRWDFQNWVALIKLLLEYDHTFRIVLLGDKAERKCLEVHLREFDGRGEVVNLAGTTKNLYEVAGLISCLDMLVTTDSGPKHLAFALNVPTITLYGISDERRWGAYWNRDIHRAVRVAPTDLTTDELLGFPPNHMMHLISPETAMRACIDILRRLRS